MFITGLSFLLLLKTANVMKPTVWILPVLLIGVSSMILSFNSKDESLPISIISGENRISLDVKGQTIQLKRSGFSLEFFVKPYSTPNKEFNAARIAFFTEEESFKAAKVGRKMTPEFYLASGHGMAQENNGSNGYVHLANDAFNYIFYESPERRRAELIKEQNGFLHLSCKFNNLLLDFKQPEIPLEESRIPYFYVVVFIDRDHDGVIDKGELAKAKLVFED